MSSTWLLRQPRPAPRVRLICFPYAGGGVGPFRSWGQELPASVEVCAVKLPGREKRLAERPIDRVEPLVEALVAALSPELDLPCALFGHSMGAVLAFELAHALVGRGGRAPCHLFLSARRPPHLPARERALVGLPDAEFLAEIRGRYGSHGGALDHPDLVELMLPALKADCALCDTHRHQAVQRLAIPVTAFAGRDDAMATPEEIAAWREHTTGPFEAIVVDGDHFFITSQPGRLVASIGRALEAL